MADLLINGKDALKMGVRMGDGFINSLLIPFPIKDYIENESRLEHGKRIEFNNLKKDSREVTLMFNIEGNNFEDFRTKLKDFEAILYRGKVEIEVPKYKAKHILTYRRCNNLNRSFSNLFCSILVRFTEDIIV